MLLNNRNRDIFKPSRSHTTVLGTAFGRMVEDLHRFSKGIPSARRIYESILVGQTKTLS